MSATPTEGFLVVRRLAPADLIDRGGDIIRATLYRGTGRHPVATTGLVDDREESGAQRELFRVRAEELGDEVLVSALGWHPWLSSLELACRVLRAADVEEPGRYEIIHSSADLDSRPPFGCDDWRLAGYDVCELRFPEHSLLAWLGYGLNAWLLQADVVRERLDAERLAFVRSERQWLTRFFGVYPVPDVDSLDKRAVSTCSALNGFGLLTRSDAMDLLAVVKSDEPRWLEPDWSYVVRSVYLPTNEVGVSGHDLPPV